MILSSLIAVIYIWRVVETAFFKTDHEPTVAVKEAPLSLLVPIWLLIGANIWLGIDASIVSDIATRAATTLLGEGF